MYITSGYDYTRRFKKNKYSNKKIKFEDKEFDSQKEARRFKELSIMQDAGLIKDLKRQVKFTLIPTQREPDVTGPKGGIKKGKVIEKECSYYADFVYYDNELKQQIVEDTKGFRTTEYIIKRKLMLAVHGIRIKEI